MHRRRSQGGFLFPANDDINRVGQLARHFEGLDLVVDLGDIRTTEMEGVRELDGQGPQGEQDARNERGVRESPPGSPTRGLDEDIRAMRESGQPMLLTQPSPIVLDAVARSYELRGMHINMLPSYSCTDIKDPLQFMKDYQAIVESFPIGRLTEEQLKMRCFRYCLKDAARTWFGSLRAGVFTTWNEVCQGFFGRFFPAPKTKDIRI